MANSGIITPKGLNLAQNPLALQPGEMIRCVNVTSDQFGAKKKRPGYTTYLGTADNAVVDSLFNFTKDNGTQFWNYRASGGTVYYSQQGTGDWTNAGNGTMTAGTYMGNVVMENTMMIGDGVSASRHTTNGTSFTNTSSAPIAGGFVDYQGRIWARGTSSDMFYSQVGTPTGWTGDSSSIHIPGPGKLNGIEKVADRIVTTKNSGVMHRYDGYNLYDLSTRLGFTSPAAVVNVEDYRFGLNRLGVYGFGGERPEIVSNPIEKQIYNDAATGIVGTVFDNAPAGVYRYEMMWSVGNITDDLTNETLTNALLVHDYQTSEWGNFTFANRPTSFLTYKDATGNDQFVFGDATGQCYTYGGTATSDNGATIPVVMEGIVHGDTLLDKKWEWIRLMFNPGCEAMVQVAISNTFTKGRKNWINVGQAIDGVVEFRFPEGTRGKFLYWKINESSRTARLNFYGLEFSAEAIAK